MKNKYLRIFSSTGLALVIFSSFGILSAQKLIEYNTQGKVFNSTEEIPYNKVGLLLGTGKNLSNGGLNPYYQYRIEAAVQLHQSKKIDIILVSGDNSTIDYDEPTAIKEDLINSGIPESKIFLDYAGFRTLDSVVRSKEIFGQDSITIISQQFHNERAIYIAAHRNIQAVGFNAKDVNAQYGLKTKIREKLARVKMMLDLTFGKQPKFLGEKIDING